MGIMNVSGIGKPVIQGVGVNVAGGSGEEDLKVTFCELMGQMSGMVAGSMDTGSGFADVQRDAPPKADGAVTDSSYDRPKSREIVMRQEPERRFDAEAQEKLDTFAEKVKEVIGEELDVTDDQIAEAMEALGITFVDLLNPNQLAALVAELKGTEDVGALLCDGAFLNVMKAVGELGSQLLNELGLTAEEFAQMLEVYAGQEAKLPDLTEEAQDGVTEAVQEPVTEGMEQKASEQAVAQSQPEKPQETTAVPQEHVSGEQAAEQPVEVQAAGKQEPQQQQSSQQQQQEPQRAVSEQAAEQEPQQTGSGQPEEGQTDAAEGHLQADRTADSHPDMAGTQAPGQNFESVVEVPVTEQTPYTNQLDVSNIIKQIVEYTRIAVNNTETTLQMQLNPEHLGKVFLELTSKNGEVSARIMAQNELVKEALESQVAELRQNMNQAGVKVAAIEVTVGSHEFERNLEQNAKREEQQAQEQEKSLKRNRRINLGDLDELGGLMTEEENLVAQIMADQGNSIDYIA